MAKKKPRNRRAKATVVSFRCPDDMLLGLEAYLEVLRKETPGGNWTRSSAAMNLVALGLRSVDEKLARRKAIAQKGGDA